MLIKTIPVGHLETNCYVVTDENTLSCALIDPGDESNTIMDYLEDNHLKCKAILLTHGHFDHTGAVAAIAEETGAQVWMNKRDLCRPGEDEGYRYAAPADCKFYDEGDCVDVDALHFQVLATPGHTPGGVCLICGDALFTGDTLFKGSCGRVDLPGGSAKEEMQSLRKLCMLPGDYEVYPGHMDCSTLERERSFNYYCREAMN